VPRIFFAFKTEKDGSKVVIYHDRTRRECERASRPSPFPRGRRYRFPFYFPSQRRRLVTEVVEIARPGSSAELESDPFYSSS